MKNVKKAKMLIEYLDWFNKLKLYFKIYKINFY